MKRLPVGLADTSSCTPDLTVEDSTVDAAVDCDPKAVTDAVAPSQKVLAYHSVNKADFDADVKAGENGLQTAKFNCQGGVPSSGTWTHDSVTAGAFYCFITNDQSQNSALAWTTDKNLDTLVIYNKPGSGRPGIAALYKYWAAVPNHETT